MDKRQTVIDSIKKLISLGVLDEEIIENLYDVGIAKDDAVSLISEARGGVKPSEQASVVEQSKEVIADEEPKRVFEGKVNSLSMNEQIAKQLALEKQKKPLAKKPVEVVEKLPDTIEDAQVELTPEEGEDEEDFEAKVKSNLANTGKTALEQKESPPASVEVPQFVLPTAPKKQSISFDSSPDFEELWKKGIVVAVNAKLSEMKKLKGEIDAQVQEKVDESIRKELYQFKVLLDSQKDLIISSNKEALEQKQKEISFIIDAKIAELRQYNKQLSDTLSKLEAEKQQQALSLQQITQSLDEARKTKSQLIIEMNSEMIKTKSQAQEFIDSASRHLDEMDAKINKTLELERNIAEGLVAQAEQKIEQLAISRADELIANLEVELNRIQTITKKISPESLEQKIQVLEEFKKQFLSNMLENITQINVAIDEVNKRSAVADKELKEKSLAIDAKLEELTKFEKEFTDKMEKLMKKK